MNSFSAIQKACEYEIKRQIKAYESGEGEEGGGGGRAWEGGGGRENIRLRIVDGEDC